MSKRALVTGGAGFIGSHLALRLLSEGFKVTVMDNLHSGKEENVPKAAKFIKADLSNETSFTLLGNLDYDVVFHLAGQSSAALSFEDPFYDFRSHVFTTLILMQWCVKMGIKRFLYSSSMAVYGDPAYLPIDEKHPLGPKSFYAAAKISAETYIRFYQTLGINSTILRLFNVYGPGQNLENKMQGMLSIYLAYMLENKPVLVKGSKERFRDFVYVDDVVDAFIMAYNNPASFAKTYNIATGVSTKVKDLLEALKVALGHKDYPVEYIDNTPGDQFGLTGDNKRIKEELHWEPKVSLQEGILKTVNFEKAKRESRYAADKTAPKKSI